MQRTLDLYEQYLETIEVMARYFSRVLTASSPCGHR